jgi:lipopolysaccharide transport system ATP-binding protein
MSDFAIRVEHLGKQYRLGRRQTNYSTFREALVKAAKVPYQWLKGDHKHEQNCFWALDEVSFEVKHGQAVGIIGRNGAGKSTLLKILSRITSPTRGRVDLYGRVGSLLEVGTGFHPELSGRENIYLNGAILGMTRREINRKFEEIVDFAEIEKFLDTAIKFYSSGMYVRLAFAVAAHLEPEILIVDEVLAVGDAEFQKKCLGKMGEVANQGRTVLFVSHNMTAVQNLCTHCIHLESGKLVSIGSAQTVIDQYLSRSHAAIQTQGADLDNWSNRSGNGRAKIIRFDIFDKHGNPTSEISFKEIVRYRLTCYFPEPIDATFGVLIHSLAEVPLIDLRSANSGLRSGKLQGEVVVDVETRALNLYPGDYYLSPWIMDRMMREDIDFVHYCTKLNIIMPAGYKHVLLLDPTWGKYVVDSTWKIIR